MSKEKNIPTEVKLDELMDARYAVLCEMEMLRNQMITKSKEIDKKIIELQKEKDDLLKPEAEKLEQWRIKLEDFEDSIGDLMKENNIKEFDHSTNFVKFAGRRSIDIKKAKEFLNPNVYSKLVKETINVGDAESKLSPDIISEIIKEGKPKLKFLKPKEQDVVVIH